MRDAESISAPPAEVANRVRIVGPRAFVYSDNTWVDTAFDPDMMQTVEIAFLSDDYFALVAADPQLGAAFALGTSVIAPSNGIAYQIVAAEAVVPALEIPEIQDHQLPMQTEATATLPASLAQPTPEEITLERATPTPVTQSDPSPAGNIFPCLGGMLPLALFPLVGLLSIQVSKRK
jgi:hypothetical protein